LYFYREIIKNASKYLNESGHIIFEIGYDQGEQVKDLLIQNNFTNIEIINDLAGFDRTVVGKLK
ncbi:MAG: protein-(glutamine-N5) methyltransferase, release factor-specific, partial [Anaerofustis stercorihominis]